MRLLLVNAVDRSAVIRAISYLPNVDRYVAFGSHPNDCLKMIIAVGDETRLSGGISDYLSNAVAGALQSARVSFTDIPLTTFGQTMSDEVAERATWTKEPDWVAQLMQPLRGHRYESAREFQAALHERLFDCNIAEARALGTLGAWYRAYRNGWVDMLPDEDGACMVAQDAGEWARPHAPLSEWQRHYTQATRYEIQRHHDPMT
jgi:hypothetical protein